jgi:flagellar capping protein FliD
VGGVVRLFTDKTAGIGARMVAAVDARTDSIDGTVPLREKAFKDSMKELDKRIARAQDALDTYEQSLVTRFAQYEQLIGTLQAQGSSLSAIGTTSSSSS